jgi:hypothetical protein
LVLPYTGTGFAGFINHPKTIGADKTAYIEKLDANPSYQCLFLRPRRFGKSTFLEILVNYYDKLTAHKFNDLFGDLYIGKNPTPAANSLLVLEFNFSEITVLDSMEKRFNEHINTTLGGFLSRYTKYLMPFKKGALIDRNDGAKSLKDVLVRGRFTLLFPSLTDLESRTWLKCRINSSLLALMSMMHQQTGHSSPPTPSYITESPNFSRLVSSPPSRGQSRRM